MERVVVLGPGGCGKSTFARALGQQTGLPVTELDKVFWSGTLEPTPRELWALRQKELCAAPQWILDGDLGPFDILEVRLRRADTVVLFDLPTWRCAWRALRRGRERRDFWRWLLTWRRRSRPVLLTRIAEEAPQAVLAMIHRPGDVDAFLAVARKAGPASS
jgi:adenylate kinase family enzyme